MPMVIFKLSRVFFGLQIKFAKLICLMTMTIIFNKLKGNEI